jgi:sulfate transport system ATP-binding protein
MSIVLDKISKSYGSLGIVKNVSLEIQHGELFVLLGASGSGKSTILRMIAGLSKVDQGRIFLSGRDVTRLRPQVRGVGFVFQNYSLFQNMTVAQNIGFGLEIKKVSRQEREKRVNELLELIGLANLGERMPSQLSGGQQQRVAVARALAHRPEVLLLDEPFGALDVKIRAQLRQNLREIQKQLGVTAILVTHDQDEAFELADRIGVIEGGQLLEVGAPDHLYRRPKHPFTATFLGNANLFAGENNGSGVQILDTDLTLTENTDGLNAQKVSMMVRPESIYLTRTAEAQYGNVLGKGFVRSVAFAGAMERVTVRLDNGQDLLVLMNMNRTYELALHPGAEVWVGVRDYHLLAANQ